MASPSSSSIGGAVATTGAGAGAALGSPHRWRCDASRDPTHLHASQHTATFSAMLRISRLTDTRSVTLHRQTAHDASCSAHSLQKTWPHGFSSTGSRNESMHTAHSSSFSNPSTALKLGMSSDFTNNTNPKRRTAPNETKVSQKNK